MVDDDGFVVDNACLVRIWFAFARLFNARDMIFTEWWLLQELQVMGCSRG